MRYEPLVDVQSRNTAEAQGDVTIRGGIFENTGFKVGAVTLFDPQTGHYFAEIPIDPAMLSTPDIATGIDNALLGFNSNVGTIDYTWTRVQTGGRLSVEVGDHDFNRQYGRFGQVFDESIGGKQVAVEASYARSESDGTVRFGDHDFDRYSTRVQLFDDHSQTDFFAGYQSKFFSWPFLYAPEELHQLAGTSGIETENLKTSLFAVNHRQEYGDASFLEAGAYYRSHADDYEFDRFRPGLSNDFEHRTRVASFGFQGLHHFSAFGLRYGGQVLGDSINTTNLNNGPFQSRTYYKLTLLPEKTFALNEKDSVTVRAGASFDDTNRDGSTVSPLLGVSLDQNVDEGSNRYYFEYSETSQVPGYTVLGANPTGLFAGNPNAGRERSHNIEIGSKVIRDKWQARLALFYRIDDDLIDWTFSENNFNARTANPVDIDTFGVEATWFADFGDLDLILGYTFLEKDEDYGDAEVDGSFYALNFAKHRLTAAFIWEFMPGWTIRSDNEIRMQEDNDLRSQSDETLLSLLSLSWQPARYPDWRFNLAVDNLWDSNFEDIPGVPGSRRQLSFGVDYTW